MTKDIEFRDFYKKILKTFDLGQIGTELLTKIMAGSEKSDDYEEVLKHDAFFTATICKKADDSLKTSTVKSLGHAVVLIGQQGTRNMVLGHLIQRLFSPKADEQYQNFEEAAKKIKYALIAEEQAKKIKNEYTGIAFAAGFIFDIFKEWINQDPKLSEKFTPLFDYTWKHSLKAATIAWTLATHESVLISYRKIIFAATLLHDIGKLGLAVYDPEIYQKCLEKMNARRELYPLADDYEVQVEKEFFDLSHVEVGSALIFRTRVLHEMELEIDFHFFAR